MMIVKDACFIQRKNVTIMTLILRQIGEEV